MGNAYVSVSLAQLFSILFWCSFIYSVVTQDFAVGVLSTVRFAPR
jgi:hypothetical protein